METSGAAGKGDEGWDRRGAREVWYVFLFLSSSFFFTIIMTI
jgi:hypothetical protein